MKADARRVVLQLLAREHGFPTRAFPDVADKAGLDDRDRALAREILAGTIRMQRALDATFTPFCKKKKMDPMVRWTLRMGVYQMLYLDRIPAHAAVDATLRAASPFIRHAKGFANAILRSVERAHSESPQEFFEKAWCRASKGPLDRISVEHSFPTFLVERWTQEVGSDICLQRLQALNGPAPMALRANILRSTAKQVQVELLECGVQAEKAESVNTLLLPASRDPRPLPGFVEGMWSVQDVTSQESAALAKPKAGERILDLCAAPGGKSFACFELSNGKAEIHACDLDAQRLKSLSPDADRLGHNIHTHEIDSDGSGVPNGEWDLILLDVPCSNTGVLGKRPEARWRFNKKSLMQSVENQRKIARTAFRLFTPGKTRILWSTCSLEPEENSEMAKFFTKEAKLELSEERLFEPTNRRAGGYAALLK